MELMLGLATVLGALSVVGSACPLWVISGHVWLLKNASALPLKADMISVGTDVR